LSANVNNLIKTLEILGLTYWNPSTDPVISSLISEWKNALQQKNYSLADSYRQKLMDMRIISG
jgi:cysteinyl-tRNA synthetase